jgi:hypothetical protein
VAFAILASGWSASSPGTAGLPDAMPGPRLAVASTRSPLLHGEILIVDQADIGGISWRR